MWIVLLCGVTATEIAQSDFFPAAATRRSKKILNRITIAPLGAAVLTLVVEQARNFQFRAVGVFETKTLAAARRLKRGPNRFPSASALYFSRSLHLF